MSQPPVTSERTTSPAALLDGARAALARQRTAEVEVLVAVADWADAHTEGGVVADQYGPFGLLRGDTHLLPGADVFGELGGPGAPLVSEFCVVEIAAALGLSTDSGRRLVGEAVELRHRLPRLWNRVVDGALPVWRARKIAQETTQLTFEGAEFVDRHLAPVAHKTGMVTAQKLVAEAIARFDPEKAELDRADSDATRRFDIDLQGQVDPARGVVAVSGTLDLADALDLENAVSRVAADLALAGSLDSLDARRSSAVGEIARRQTTLDLSGCDNADAVRTTTGEASNQTGSDTAPAASVATRSKARQVVLHVHLSEAALTDLDPNACGGVDLARIEKTRSFVLADQVREWCRATSTQVVVKPVIDLRDRVAVDAYEVPDRIAERVRLTRPTCVFPHCTRPARGCDLDHVDEYVPPDPNHPGDGGPPGQTSTTNLAPLCRRHHRVKTHPSLTGAGHERRWRYRRLLDGSFVWTSPHDQQYLVDTHGTIALPA